MRISDWSSDVYSSDLIITRNNSPDIGFDRSINPYRGCEHGCIYCFARPTHAYHDLSPGIDFETKLFAKPSAPELLKKELAKRGYEARPIAFGTNRSAEHTSELQSLIIISYAVFCLKKKNQTSYYLCYSM